MGASSISFPGDETPSRPKNEFWPDTHNITIAIFTAALAVGVVNVVLVVMMMAGIKRKANTQKVESSSTNHTQLKGIQSFRAKAIGSSKMDETGHHHYSSLHSRLVNKLLLVVNLLNLVGIIAAAAEYFTFELYASPNGYVSKEWLLWFCKEKY
jgi:hypothetical protein